MSNMIASAALKAQIPFEASFQVLVKIVRRFHTKRVLNKLTSTQLDDIGLTRKEINAFVARNIH